MRIGIEFSGRKRKRMTSKLIVLDRDGLLINNSSDINSPFYYILQKDYVVIKDGVYQAMAYLQSLGVPVVMASKQRCIKKGLISRADVDSINSMLEEMLNFKFDQIYIEEADSLKTELFGQILNDYKLNPEDVLVIDDSIDEIMAAHVLGFKVIHTDQLVEAIKNV